MMNRVEMNEEMMEAVVGGREYHVGDHVEVKGLFDCTQGGTIINTYINEDDETEYLVRFDAWYMWTEWYEAESFDD